jgi:cytochrome oxidase Cu insertion factor (SCO1/SenC/PrrC family)
MNTSWNTVGLIVVSLVVTFAAIGHTEGDGEMISVGEPFVDFKLQAHDGSTVSSADLEGRPFLLFFYPKADTPG